MAIEAKSGRNTSALMKPLTPQGPLAAIVGASPLPRGQVVAKVWDYIRANNLQKPTDKRVILADDKLKAVFGKDECTMFEMNKFIAQYLK
jgi:chromatin remodeling complex protein RSC6